MGIPSSMEAIVPEIYDLWDRGEVGDNYFIRSIYVFMILLFEYLFIYFLFFRTIVEFEDRYERSNQRKEGGGKKTIGQNFVRPRFQKKISSNLKIKFLSFTRAKYPAKRSFYCANNRTIFKLDFHEKTKPPMKNFIPYFLIPLLYFHKKLPYVWWYASYFQPIDKRSNFILLLYSSCLAVFEWFRSIFKSVFFPSFLSFLPLWFYRNEEAKRERYKLDAEGKAHQNLIDRSFCDTGNARLFTVCINASFEWKQFCRSGVAWRGENSKPGQFRNAFNEAGHF